MEQFEDSWVNDNPSKIPDPVFSFLQEIEEVCRKHKLSISHEDGHGVFIIEGLKESNLQWLNAAIIVYKPQPEEVNPYLNNLPTSKK